MTAMLRASVLAAVLAFALLSSGASGWDEMLGAGAVQPGSSLAAPAGEVPLLDHDGHGMWDWDGWGWIVMMPMMLIFWGGLIWLIVWLVRRTGGETGSRENDPIEIARRRYARGEISGDELEQIRRNLSG